MCEITREEKNSSLFLLNKVYQYNYYHSKQNKKTPKKPKRKQNQTKSLPQKPQTNKKKITKKRELGVTIKDQKLFRKGKKTPKH